MTLKTVRAAVTAALFLHSLCLFAVTNFTPAIDGFKEAAWGSTPDATSSSYRSIGGAGTYHSQNACQDVYVTDDPQNLYIGYYYNGDGWDDGEGNSSRIMFGILTNTAGTSGGDSDPWESTTVFGSSNKPDFFLRQWTEAPYDERMEFGGALGYSTATKGVAEFLRWNGSAWVGTGVSINHYERLTSGGAANNWGEIAIPLSTLGIKTGETIKLFMYYRPNPDRPGYSDSTPFDPNCSDEAYNSGSGYALNTNFSYTIQSDNVAPELSAITPGHTETGLGRNTSVSFTVTDNKDMSGSSISVVIEGNDAILNGIYQSGYTGSIAGTGATRTVTITPASIFSYNQRVNITITVSDAAGNTVEKTYYFDIQPDTTAPVLSGISPSPDATGISLSGSLQFSISDDDQIVQNSLLVRINGLTALSNGSFQTGFAGSSSQVVPSGSGYSVLIDPETAFSFGQTVSVSLSGKDLAGNSVSTNYSFTTTEDNIAPGISSRTPAPGINNAGQLPLISFQLTDNLGIISNKISVTAGGRQAITNGAFLTGFTGSISSNGTGFDISLTAETSFAFSSNVQIQVHAEDAQGNALNDSWSFSIKTDDEPPQISGRFPQPAATGQPRTANIVFTAADADSGIDITSVDVTVNGISAVQNGSGTTGYVFSYTATNGGFICTVNPETDFTYEQAITVTAAFRDNSANKNRYTTTWTFTVESDSTAPILTALSPSPNASGINTNSLISMQLSDESGLDNATVLLAVNGQTALSNGSFLAPYNGPLSQMSSSGGIISLTVDSSSPFPYKSTNTISLSARDSAGNLLTTNYSFIIQADDIDPLIGGLSPGNGSSGIANNAIISMDITDNSAVDPASIIVQIQTNGSSWTTAYLSGSFSTGFTGGLTTISNGYRLSFKPDNDFAFNTAVNLKITAQDMEGNSVSLNPWSFSIQSGDAVAPTISKFNPYNGQTGVEPDSTIYLETADNVRVSKSSINIHIIYPAGGGTKVAVTNGTFTPAFSGSGSSIQSNAYGGYDIRIDASPTGPFAFTNSYTVHASVRDTSINSNSATASCTFTIRPPDTQPPQLVSINPSDNSSDIPVSTPICMILRDNYGIDLNTIIVSLNGTTIFSNGCFSSDFQGSGSTITANADNGYNITIDPVNDFTFGQTINLRLTMSDTSLNTTVRNVSFRVLELKAARPLTNIIDPKNGNRNIQVKINRTGFAAVSVYNIRGEKVWTLPERFYNAGDIIEWSGILHNSSRIVGSGYYFFRITGSDINTTVRVLVVR